MPKIAQTLKQVADDTLKASLQNSSSIDPYPTNTFGDPNCPICKGVGFIRQDLPIGHPDFGKLQICTCSQERVNQAMQEKLYRLSNLEAFRKMTFETFNPQGLINLGAEQTRTLEMALNQATQFARKLEGWLLLMGGYGCGKTHLAAAIANHAVSMGVPTLFLTVPDLLDWLRFSFDSTDSTFEERFNEIRDIQLLVLDDLGTQNTTAWAAEKLFQIINYRYINRLPLVITTNQELKEIDGRIVSRLLDTELVSKVKITAQDYRRKAEDLSHPPLSVLHLYQEQTFGNFSLREREKLTESQQQSIEKAFKTAHEYAENPRGWLVLLGDYSTGKTHLAAAIGNYRHSLGETALFVVVPDLLDHLRATFGPSSNVSYDNLFDQVRMSPLLILDDLGTQSATPWAREKLYQIFNYRYIAQLPTVITSSSTLEELDPRIRSRMLDKRICTIIMMDVPSYRIGMEHLPKTKSRRRKIE